MRLFNKLPRLSKDLAITDDMDYAEALERKANQDCCRLTDAILKFAVKGRIDLVKMLISHQQRLYKGAYYSALMLAINENYDLSIVKTLVDSGDQVINRTSDDGLDALGYSHKRYFMNKLDHNGINVHNYLMSIAY